MDTNIADKKVSLEELSSEELVKKCKNLLSIAQKAKQTKSVLQVENIDLKNKLESQKQLVNQSTNEIIENLTQQKLEFVTIIEDLKLQNKTLTTNINRCKEHEIEQELNLSKLDCENVSYKRQVTRLTDENEQLITHLETLEKEIGELKRIGLEQQSQLLSLEESNKTLQTNICKNEIASTCQINPENKPKIDKNIENIVTSTLKFDDKATSQKERVEELISLQQDSEEIHSDLKLSESEHIDLFSQEIPSKLQENVNVDVSAIYLTELNIKLKEKLKLYHSKLIKFASNVKSIKEEKNQTLHQFKLYTNQVKEWKDSLNLASEMFIKLVSRLETENNELKKKNQQLETHKTDDEKSKSFEEIEKLRGHNLRLVSEASELKILLNDKEDILKKLENEKNLLDIKVKEVIDKFSSEIDEKTLKNVALNDENLILKKTCDNFKNNMKELKEEIQVDIDKLNMYQKTRETLEININKLNMELEKSKATEKKLAERSGEEIIKLVNEVKELEAVKSILEEKVEKYEQNQIERVNLSIQTDETYVPPAQLEEQVVNLKMENAQLLLEMNEMNQALKERGENVSQLHAHCEEVMKKLQKYETQANKNDNNITKKEEFIKELQQEISALKIINRNAGQSNINQSLILEKDEELKKLRNEIDLLKEKINANVDNYSLAESDAMSTSTISRTEEINRLKDLEGSWEERYGKLRNLAVKLKAKIKELSNDLAREKLDKTNMQQKMVMKLESIPALQSKIDELEDHLICTKEEASQCLLRVDLANKENEHLLKNTELMNQLKLDNEELQKQKVSTDIWKKQISSKVQTLRKELQDNEEIKKELENKITTLFADLETKEKALNIEMESHQQTKNSLLQSNSTNKKNSVLNLEMQDYEKSVKELSQKLEKNQEQIVKLKGQVDSHKGVINTLRDQNKLLSEKVETEQFDLTAAINETNLFKKKHSDLETAIAAKQEYISFLTQQLEVTRSQNEELSTEMSKDISEHQKIITSLKEDKEGLGNQIFNYQQLLRESQSTLKLKEDQLEIIQAEYDNYKVRAQSVLRQNQSRDVVLEEKLTDHVSTLENQIEALNLRLREYIESNELIQKENETLKSNLQLLSTKHEDIHNELNDFKQQYNNLLTKHNQAIDDNSETVRSLKIHADTLTTCYRQQLADQEVRHNREIIDLQNKIDKAVSPSDAPLTIIPTMLREEGEGSESVESGNFTNSQPIPLERLLGNDEENETVFMKKQLSEHESKVVHLTDLLADTEQDLAKHVQMNKLLKEEIRRQQRAVAREPHAENLEYLKNVVFKFVTLSNCDERCRLVPVLNTILQLSPDETNKLNMVARGDPGFKAWSSYLPTWSSPNKS